MRPKVDLWNEACAGSCDFEAKPSPKSAFQNPKIVLIGPSREVCLGSLERAVTFGVEIRTRQRGCFVRSDANSFQSNSFGRLVVEFANVQHTTIRQRMAVSNSQHTTASHVADHSGASLLL